MASKKLTRALVAASILLLLALAPAAPARPAAAVSLVYQVDMYGADEVPPVFTAAWGFVRFFFNDDRTAADYTVDVKGISGSQVLGADIHRGRRGASGPAVFHLADGGFIVTAGRINLRPADLDNMVAGNWYVSLKTTIYPEGELRGQILLPAGAGAGLPPAPPPPAAAAVIFAQPAPPPPPAQVLFLPAIVCGESVSATFRWRPLAGAYAQWVDLTTSALGFDQGGFFGAGPLSPSAAALTWTNLEPGVPYFWRVNALTPAGWAPSDTSSFVAC